MVTNNNSRTYYVRIRDDSETKYEQYPIVVVPGHCHVKEGAHITFLTGEFAKIYIPEIDKLFEGNPSEEFTIEPKEPPVSFTVKTDSAREKFVFPYSVYCLDIKEFAEGGTTPRMIVE